MASPSTAVLFGTRVIACHDDPAILNLIVKTLREAGCQVVKAYDGLACYELALELPAVRLLVVNSHLGEMDGPSLIQHFCTELPHIAVLHTGPDPDHRVPPDVPTLSEPFNAEQLLPAVGPLVA